jgi:AcrR family transcriptional regulator
MPRPKSAPRANKKGRLLSDEPWSFSLADILRTKAAESDGSKGDRTLLKLKAGAAATLNSMPYQTMRVADIVKVAGVSHGLFYHYFKDKESITLEILAEMIRTSEQRYSSIHAPKDAFEGIYLANLYYLHFYQKNAGLMRAALTLSDEVDAFRHLWNDAVDRWHKRIARAIRAQSPSQDINGIDAEILAYCLGAMIDQICRQLFVQENPHLQQIARDLRHLNEVLSIAWYRSTHGRDPSSRQIESCRSLVFGSPSGDGAIPAAAQSGGGA